MTYRFWVTYFNWKNRLGISPKLGKNNTLVLVYHGVTNHNPLEFNSRFIHLEELRKHLDFFQSACNVLSLSDFLSGKNRCSDRLNVVLTFDDGYKNNYSLALPELEKRNIPATFCICFQEPYKILWADLVDISKRRFPEEKIEFLGRTWSVGMDGEELKQRMITATSDEMMAFYTSAQELFEKVKKEEDLGEFWELMSPDEVEKLVDHPLIELVPHGVIHQSLKGASESDWKRELVGAKERMENLLGDSMPVFCYPNGHYTPELLDFAERNGIQHHLLVDVGRAGAETRFVKRFVINPHISFNLQKHFFYKGDYS